MLLEGSEGFTSAAGGTGEVARGLELGHAQQEPLPAVGIDPSVQEPAPAALTPRTAPA